jgi:1-phosphofructokinase
MITTITLNPAVDKSVIFSKVELGAVNRMVESQNDIGGKGINVSKVVSFLGVKTIASGILGSVNSLIFKEFMSENNIANAFIEVYGSTRTNIKVLELDESRTTDLNDKGIEICENTKAVFEQKLLELSLKSDYIVFSGSLPPGLDDSYYGELTRLIRDHTKVVIDASGKKLIEAIKASPSIVKPNIEELEEAFDVVLDTPAKIKDFCLSLINEYNIDEFIVTLGSEGSVLITKDQSLYSKPIKVEALNTVSAGDSYLGGYLATKVLSDDLTKSLSSGVASGTLAVTKKGTELFTQDEYEAMLDRVEIIEL